MSTVHSNLSGPDAVRSIASLFKTQIGTRSGYKCVEEDGKYLLIRSPSILLQNLHIEHPVGQYLVSVCQSFHNEHGNTVKTLLYYVGAMMKIGTDLQQQGVSVGNIVTTLNKSIDICLGILEETKIPLGKLIDKTVLTNPERKESPCGPELSGQDQEQYLNVKKQTPLFCEMVNLKLKTSEKQSKKQQGKNVGEPEDISWFFEGENKVLPKLLGTEDMINVTSGSDKCQRYKTSKSQNIPLSKSDEISITQDPQDNVEKQKERKDDYEDDEFGSCFDGIPHSQSYSTHVNDTKSNSYAIKGSSLQTNIETDDDFYLCYEDIQHSQESSNKCDNTNSYQKQNRNRNTEDDFDSCFNNLPKRYSSSSIIDTNIASKLQEDCFAITVSPQENHKRFTNNSKITEVQDSSNKVMQFESKSDFEQKLAAVIKSKNLAEGQNNRKIHNNSRHFKTVESSVQNMNEISIIDQPHDKYTTSSNIGNQMKPLDTSLHGIPSSKSTNRTENSSKELNPQVNNELANLDSMLKNLKRNKIKKDNSSMSQSRHFRQMKDCIIFTDKETVLQTEQLINGTQDDTGTMSDKLNKEDEYVKCSQDSESEFLKYETNWNIEKKELDDSKKVDVWTALKCVASGLSHGAEEIMNIVVDASILQQNIVVHQDIDSSQLRFNPTFLHTCCVQGAIKPHKLVLGLVLPISITQLPCVENAKGRQLRTVLINGDVSKNFKHIGFKRPIKEEKTSSVQTFISNYSTEEDNWLQDVLDILIEFSVDVVLIKGTISEDIEMFLQCHGLITIAAVPYKALTAISSASRAMISSYITDIDKVNICTGLELTSIDEDWMMKHAQESFVKISCPGITLQTIFVSHPIIAVCDVVEEEIHRCACVLSSTLENGCVFPGEGATEDMCSQRLMEEAEILNSKLNNSQHSDDQCFLPGFLHDLSKMMREFVWTVKCNQGVFPSNNQYEHINDTDDSFNHSGLSTVDKTETEALDFCQSARNPQTSHKDVKSESLTHSKEKMDFNINDCENISPNQTYDSYASKMAALQTAAALVTTVLQCDTYIITGLHDQSDKPSSDFRDNILSNNTIL